MSPFNCLLFCGLGGGRLRHCRFGAHCVLGIICADVLDVFKEVPLSLNRDPRRVYLEKSPLGQPQGRLSKVLRVVKGVSTHVWRIIIPRDSVDKGRW